MRVTVIGPGPAYTRRPGRASSCYLVESGPTSLLLDLGQGSFAALGARRPPETLSAIAVSHLHPDHHADLVPLRHYLKYGLTPPRSVELRAPPDLRRRYDVLLGEDGFLDALPGDDLEPGAWLAGSLVVTCARVTHAGESFAFRVVPARTPGGPGLVYSGDCGRPEELAALVCPGDTLLSEASWGRGPGSSGAWHLTAAQAGWAASEGGAARLVLTHVLDEWARGAGSAARRAFRGPVLLARPGLRLEVP